MKGVIVYHQIKALRREYSVRESANQLGVSVNTVRKYEALGLSAASDTFGISQRSSQFGVAREFIADRVSQFPRISAVKLLRQVKARYPEITGHVRAFRDYLKPLRASVQPEKARHFEPVLDMEAGHQVQVDGGESRVIRPDGAELKVYFVVFVFSYSRQMYVHFQGRPYDTETFILAHRQAFSFFGGVAREYVYDQTKLVVINEQYREVFLNERFHRFALTHDFLVRVCEGYDPQSKGKVERGVGYVKDSFLYGEHFLDITDIQRRSADWLNTVANIRLHGVTGQRPVDMFETERPLLSQGYAVVDPATRQVDKTGLLSFEGNKYSAPFAYQQKEVAVESSDGALILRDKQSGAEIARHDLSEGRGRIFKNNNHYRDYRKSLSDLTVEALVGLQQLPDRDELIARLVADNPKIARDQLRGLVKLSARFETAVWQAALPVIQKLPQVRLTLVESILADYKQRLTRSTAEIGFTASSPISSCLDRPLAYYQEAAHA